MPDRFRSPFGFDEWSHVATRSMLGLERTVEAMNNQIDHVVDEPRVLVRVGRGSHRLRNDEVQIAIARVAEDDSVRISVLDKHRLQFTNRIPKSFEREGHVLQDGRFSATANSSDRRVHSFAKLP